MNKRLIRLGLCVLAGLAALGGGIWWLSTSLGNQEPLYSGKTADAWNEQLAGADPSASNRAYEVLNAQIIPKLGDQMLHDTNDSKLKMSIIETLNGIPGVQIEYMNALGRRLSAAYELGTFGPPAKAAVPYLIEALQGPNAGLEEGSHHSLHDSAMESLGNIHSSPEVVIPFLIPYLTYGNMREEAAGVLGHYGSAARAAAPKIIPLLNANDPDTRATARAVLKQIDPDAAARAGVK
jgi:hypothetical protein